MSRDEIYAWILREIEAADARYGPMASSHEGLGVLYEEFTELTEAIRANSKADVEKEALQVAAVALRIVLSMGKEQTLNRSGMVSSGGVIV